MRRTTYSPKRAKPTGGTASSQAVIGTGTAAPFALRRRLQRCGFGASGAASGSTASCVRRFGGGGACSRISLIILGDRARRLEIEQEIADLTLLEPGRLDDRSAIARAAIDSSEHDVPKFAHARAIMYATVQVQFACTVAR